MDPPQAEANPSSNTLLVRGTKAQVEEIQRDVIDQAEKMAVTTAEELKDERIPLQYAQADEAAQSLIQFFNNKFRAYREGGVKNVKPSELTVSITPEVNSNSILVTASDNNLTLAKKMLAEMDREDIGAKSARTIETYPLTYADAGSVANVINNAYRKTGQTAERDRVQAVVEGATQSVVVIASAENQQEIAGLIKQVDQDTGASAQVREVYKLQEARASDVATIIDRTLSSSRVRTRKGQLPVSVVANDALNSLVITGTQQEYEGILRLIQELDKKPEEMTGLIVRVYQLRFADPGSTIGTPEQRLPAPAGSEAGGPGPVGLRLGHQCPGGVSLGREPREGQGPAGRDRRRVHRPAQRPPGRTAVRQRGRPGRQAGPVVWPDHTPAARRATHLLYGRGRQQPPVGLRQRKGNGGDHPPDPIAGRQAALREGPHLPVFQADLRRELGPSRR